MLCILGRGCLVRGLEARSIPVGRGRDACEIEMSYVFSSYDPAGGGRRTTFITHV